MINYVLGFAFSPDHKQVLLIKKENPPWQRGLFNGVGGKVLDTETVLSAIVREFEEETGISTIFGQWTPVAEMGREGEWRCVVFKATLSLREFESYQSPTIEEVRRVYLTSILASPESFLSNLPHLIGVCMDPDLTEVQVIQYGPQL